MARGVEHPDGGIPVSTGPPEPVTEGTVPKAGSRVNPLPPDITDGAPTPEPVSSIPRAEQSPSSSILFLDDDPYRAETFLGWYPTAVWVQTSEECISQLANSWKEVHLDHDLGGEQYVDPTRGDCGMEVVRWLCAEFREPLRETRFVVHSHNVEAARTMVDCLHRTGYHARYRPFAIDMDDVITLEDVHALLQEAKARRARLEGASWRRRLFDFLQGLGRRIQGRPPSTEEVLPLTDAER